MISPLGYETMLNEDFECSKKFLKLQNVEDFSFLYLTYNNNCILIATHIFFFKEKVQPVSPRVLSLVAKTSNHKLKILTTPKLGPKNIFSFVCPLRTQSSVMISGTQIYWILNLLDLFGFWHKFGLFCYAKLPSYKRVKWGRLAEPSHNLSFTTNVKNFKYFT